MLYLWKIKFKDHRDLGGEDQENFYVSSERDLHKLERFLETVDDGECKKDIEIIKAEYFGICFSLEKSNKPDEEI